MDIKTLQYVMGHSDIGVTLNVYTHAGYDRATEQMAKILDFKESDMQGKQKNQVEKCTNLLHHLSVTLRRFITDYAD